MPGDLGVKESMSCADAITARHRPAGLTIASFNPHVTGGDAIVSVAVNVIARLVSKYEVVTGTTSTLLLRRLLY